MSWLHPHKLHLRFRSFVNRALNFVRPKPRVLPLSVSEVLASIRGRNIVEQFIDLHYRSGTSGNLNYRSVPLLKNPCDLWMAIELFQELKPTAVLETGTHHGGSAMFYADMLRLLGIPCRVITIDCNPKWHIDPESNGIVSLVGYTATDSILAKLRRLVEDCQARRRGHVMAFLDADHSRDGVLQELRMYAELITVGSYIVVEDTIVNGHPSFPEHGPGPWEAVQEFLRENTSFEPDRRCERFLLTYNPKGWLKRVR